MGIRSEEQENSKELHIARDVIDSKHGDFLKLFCKAFAKADPMNFQILLPSMQLFIVKYDLKCTCPEGSEDRLKE